MRLMTFISAATAIVLGATPVSAETDATAMSALEIAMACSAPPSLARPPATVPHVIGGQEPVPRTLFGPYDLLVIDSGLGSGLQLGQQFFVRRQNQFGTAYGEHAISARTLGWIRIVAVNQTTAVAAVEHICDGIMAMDYLEPFVAPAAPAEAEHDISGGEPDFSALSRVLAGNEDRRAVGIGEMMMIEAAPGSTLTPGTRLAVFRDVRIAAMPLVRVGDAVVVSVGPNVALARVTRALDAVQTGDYLAVRK